MKINNISIEANLELMRDIEEAWCDVCVTSNENRIYIVQVITYKKFLSYENENNSNFLPPIAPSILVKKLTKEIIESAIHYYANEDNGYWLKFCHMGTEIDEKTLTVLTDRWFAKKSLSDFTSNSEWKEKLKSELKEEFLTELGKKSEIEDSTLE